MKFSLKKLFTNYLFWVAIASTLSLASIIIVNRQAKSLLRIFRESPLINPTAQISQIPKAQKTEKPQGTETELRKEMLNPAGDLEARLGAAKGWAKEHVSNAEKKCAAYKKKVYSSDIDPQLKDLLWGAAVVASEYCWQVDVKPKVTKPKQKKAESRLK